MQEFIKTAGEYLLRHREILQIVVPVFIAIGLALVFVPTFIVNSENIKEKFKKNQKAFISHTSKRYLQDYISCKITRWMDETYKYSRIYNTKLGKLIKTSAGYFLITFFSSAILIIGIAIITKKLLVSTGIFVCLIFTAYAALFLMRIRNRRLVLNELTNFLNLLGNYSTANTEVFSIFAQIAPQVEEPLSSCLYECVAESQDANKDKMAALQNLGNKIEDRKFKEVIKNLEIAQSNVGSYASIVATNRHSLIEYIHGKRLKEGIARENTISFAIVIAAMVMVLYFIGQLMSIDIMSALFSSPAGIVVIVIALATIIFFAFSAISAGR